MTNYIFAHVDDCGIVFTAPIAAETTTAKKSIELDLPLLILWFFTGEL